MLNSIFFYLSISVFFLFFFLVEHCDSNQPFWFLLLTIPMPFFSCGTYFVRLVDKCQNTASISADRSQRFLCHRFCLFVLRFYGPVNPMGSCRARSVYLTTRLLGRLCPLSG